MKTTGPAPASASLSDRRLWLGPPAAGPQTRLFRRAFTLADAPTAADLELYAESNYHAWINGHYLGRGPVYHHPTQRPYDTHDVRPHLHSGTNVLAVLVHTPGISLHNHVPAGEPGLVAKLTLTDAAGRRTVIEGDAAWRATADTGWSTDVPRRSWAIGHIELYDARTAPVGWQSADFDDRHWSPADVIEPATGLAGVEWLPRPLPPLRYEFVAPTERLGLHGITAPGEPFAATDPASAAAKRLVDDDWSPADASLVVSDLDPQTGGFTVAGLTPERGAVVCLALDRQYTGQLVFDARCDAPGTIDVCWAETYDNGKPAVLRKGHSYCDRVLAPAGDVHWEPIGYSSMRYLLVCLRGFTGSVMFIRFGVRTSEPALDWSAADCTFGDEQLDAVWNLCVHTLRIGTQEGVLDCPTREQAVYIGDGVLTARWIARVTGDVRHWRYLIDEQFRRQSPEGLVRSSVFSGGNDALLDYPLLAVLSLRDYWQFTGDADALRHVEAARRILGFFDNRRDADGLWTAGTTKRYARTWEYPYDPAKPRFEDPDSMHVFIDHPGMGWHNVGEAGIDRRGTNCAFNALLVQVRRALAELEDAAGEGDRATALRADADRVASVLRERFFDARRGVFVDGVFEGARLQQVSEQTNTWAVAAQACDDETTRAALTKLLTSDDPSIARNGPYFWAYLFPELARLGLHELGLRKLRALWPPMIAAGATALWETFAGDHLDSFCHPWSAAPIEFLLEHVLGLPRVVAPDGSTELRPRPDLIRRARGRAFTAAGWVAIGWETAGGGLTVTGSLPAGHRAVVIDPLSSARRSVEGEWRVSFDR